MILNLLESICLNKFKSACKILAISCFFSSCGGNQKSNEVSNLKNETDTINKYVVDSTIIIRTYNRDIQRQKIKIGHSVNTAANEYLPIGNFEGDKLYFSAMDRTGFFDFKLDFNKAKSAGGEDIYISNLEEGIWTDARPLVSLNTNGHEVITQVFKNGDLIITGNYPEKLGVKNDNDADVQTTDLFFARSLKNSYQINHLPEPVNSIYTEADGYMSDDQSFILFVSDRNSNVGEYHKKGWKWNDSYWGNTDIYVSIKDDDNWSVPINLGSKLNTPYAERTPWLSADGLTLYLSSNGYINGRTDLDVYAFKRKSINDWTIWEGPYSIDDANTSFDDWGYKETNNGDAFVASANKLSFKPTQGGTAGDGGVTETNYRPGYKLHGLQVASLNSEFESNIYHLKNKCNPTFIARDLFFDFNSYAIKKSFEKYLLLFVDQINQNKDAIIEINGHTDNSGKVEYNQELSQKRADAIKLFLVSNGVNNIIISKGFGGSKPAFPNTTDSNRSQNRRVEVYIKKDIK